ncbi:lipocalin family protein [Ferrigenium sp. UT5]|uniref:lipocalin family protein n=1 Tax=Ferrigenium sp. UT5 TaxID=3242105 RepID=UPI00354D4A82
MRKGKWCFGLFWLLPALALAQPPATVAQVDLDRYVGKWYEIASIPQYFQRQCVRDVTAEYALKHGALSVINRCATASGEISEAQGQARIVDTQSNAKLEVTFVNLFGWRYLFGGDYWIIDLAPDYRYAVVGHPGREYAWVLARTPQISAQDLTAIANRLQSNGYDTCSLLTTTQTPILTARTPLCKAVNGP